MQAAVKRIRGQLASNFASKLKGKRKKSQALAGESVVLTVSTEGVHVMDVLTNETVTNIFINDIIYTSVAQSDEDSELFCCISEDLRLANMTCQIFQMLPGKVIKLFQYNNLPLF